MTVEWFVVVVVALSLLSLAAVYCLACVTGAVLAAVMMGVAVGVGCLVAVIRSRREQ